ncbi:Cupin 2, conserved barrel [Dillenia turbinata]|uniref:Cupin 2, conserved barrel n=1 Tax=Dillenia turbinata TaxID=194707 RepID=A0AAN8UEU1_9MAGN
MAQNSERRLKIIAGADPFGAELKDALVTNLKSLPNIEVEDLGTGPYYSIAENVGQKVSAAVSSFPSCADIETRGLVACGTGIGVSMFANKFPGVFASTCLTVDDAVNTRSINNSNVLAVSGLSTPPESATQILKAWLETPFAAPCPASNSEPWPEDVQSFLRNSVEEMPKIGSKVVGSGGCAICSLVKDRVFEKVEIMPGGSMKIVRQSPTSAIVRFEGGSVEPGHHHTFGHDVLVLKGRKKVWNLSKNEEYELGVGDYLYTPSGDVHRVKYFEDTEFFIRWDGDWDIFLDEDLAAAKDALDKVL